MKSLAQLGIMYLIQLDTINKSDLQQYPDFSETELEALALSGDCMISEDGYISLPADDDLKTQFDVFRKKYPGSKNGLEPEWSNLKKKHKGYRRIVPGLLINLERQIKEREALATFIKANESQRNFTHGRHLPPWQNLQTYINQASWTRVYYEDKLPTIVGSDHPDYAKYLKWWSGAFHRNPAEMPNSIMTVSEYCAWLNCEGVFLERKNLMASESAKICFAKWHGEFIYDQTIQRQYRTVGAYINHKYKNF